MISVCANAPCTCASAQITMTKKIDRRRILLPPPHNPIRCKHEQRIDRKRDDLMIVRRRNRPPQPECTSHREQREQIGDRNERALGKRGQGKLDQAYRYPVRIGLWLPWFG